MNYELISQIGSCIDNVYNNTAESSDRRTISKLKDDCLIIEYITILTVAKDCELQMQMNNIKSESNQIIASRLKTLKASFKENAGRTLKTKRINDSDNIECLTVSAFSPIKTFKYSYAISYEVS
jgi:hypothetical protein